MTDILLDEKGVFKYPDLTVLSNMKFMLLIDDLGSGGAQKQMVNLAIGMKQLGIDFILVVYNEGNHYRHLLETHNISYTKLNTSSNLKRLRSIVSICREREINYGIAYLFMPSLLLLLCKLVSPQLKILVSERTFEENVPLFHKVFTRRLYPLAQVVTTNSVTQKIMLQRKRLNTRIHYIPNSLNSEMKDKRTSSRRRDNHILGIGRVSKLKNVHTLIEAIAKLKHSHGISVKVTWLGDISEYSKYFDYCTELLKGSDLQDAWSWGGVKKDLEKYMDEALFLYHGSFGEGFPNVVLESFGQGLPVIASDVNDHSRFIINGYNGYLFNPKSIEDLVSRLKYVFELKQPELTALSMACIERVAKGHSIEFITLKHVNSLVKKCDGRN